MNENENQNPTITEPDPLSAAAGGVDTSFPVLAADRLMDFTVKKAIKKTNEKGNTSVSLKVATVKDATFADGKPARAGFTFIQNVNITPSENFPIDSVKRQIALWLKALLGEKAKSTPLAVFRDSPESLEGLVFTARTGIKKDTSGVYGDQTQLTPVPPA